MTQIAELFVNLGVKGSDKTVSALASVKTEMGGLISSSLAFKAALVGAFYALEQFMSTSMTKGTSLENFAAYTGLSLKQLQQWQYAAQQAGESNEEFTSSLQGVYQKVAQMKSGQGNPEGLGRVVVGLGLSAKEVDRMRNDTFYLMDKLQQFSRIKTLPTDINDLALKSFGLSDNTIAAMRRGMFVMENFKRAPIMSDSEIAALNRTDVMWKNLWQRINMQFAGFTAAHGGQIVGDIEKITSAFFKLAGALDKIADKLKIFQGIATIIKSWATFIGAGSDFIDKLNGKNTLNKKGEEKNPILEWFRLDAEQQKADDELKVAKMNEAQAREDHADKLNSAPMVPQNGNTGFFGDMGSLFKEMLAFKHTNLKGNEESVFSQVTGFFLKIFELIMGFLKDLLNHFQFEHQQHKQIQPSTPHTELAPPKHAMNFSGSNPNLQSQMAYAPSIPASSLTYNATINNQNVSINQNLNFNHEGRDYAQVADAGQKSVVNAWKQLYSQTQAT